MSARLRRIILCVILVFCSASLLMNYYMFKKSIHYYNNRASIKLVGLTFEDGVSRRFLEQVVMEEVKIHPGFNLREVGRFRMRDEWIYYFEIISWSDYRAKARYSYKLSGGKFELADSDSQFPF